MVDSLINKYSFGVVGLTKDSELSIRNDINRVKDSLANCKSISWFIVESDSKDKTVMQLEKISKEVKNFNFVSLGDLKNNLEKRTARISYCRNYYVNYIKTDYLFKTADYIVVVDFDDLNEKINAESFESCWIRDDWDMCAANQLGPYYDVWALRHKDWCSSDCWKNYAFLNKYRNDHEMNVYDAVYSKMICISPHSDWIEVDSAFGGFVVYKRSAFDFCEYVGLDEDGDEICEHISFHNKLKQAGYRLFINPKLINAHYTGHTIHLLMRNRIKRSFKRIKRKIKRKLSDMLTGATS